MNKNSIYDYAGAIHVHSNFSQDGEISVENILIAAKKASIDFIMLTDHSTLKAKELGYEGWHDGVLLAVGEEVTPRYNHYLAFNTKESISKSLYGEPQKYIEKVNSEGGVGIIAHPDQNGTKKFNVKSYLWNDWSVYGYTGMSIWDLQTDWQRSLTGLAMGFISYLAPHFFLKGPKKETLEKWDKINVNNRITGIGEIDNHDTVRKMFGFNFHIFDFYYAFRTIRTHLLLEEPLPGDKKYALDLIYDAIKNRRTYVSLDYWDNPSGFDYFIKDGAVKVQMGGEYKLSSNNAEINVISPLECKIKIVKDGKTLTTKTEKKLTYSIKEKGVYRVEIYKNIWFKDRPWIFSNPIWVI